MSIFSRSTRRIDSVDSLFRRGAKFDKMLSRAEKKKKIRDVLAEYSMNLEGGGLLVSRGHTAERNQNTLEQITDIYWRLKASGTGEGIAQKVIHNKVPLKRYLEMKAEGVSDIEIAARLTNIL